MLHFPEYKSQYSKPQNAHQPYKPSSGPSPSNNKFSQAFVCPAFSLFQYTFESFMPKSFLLKTIIPSKLLFPTSSQAANKIRYFLSVYLSMRVTLRSHLKLFVFQLLYLTFITYLFLLNQLIIAAFSSSFSQHGIFNILAQQFFINTLTLIFRLRYSYNWRNNQMSAQAQAPQKRRYFWQRGILILSLFDFLNKQEKELPLDLCRLPELKLDLPPPPPPPPLCASIICSNRSITTKKRNTCKTLLLIYNIMIFKS